MSEDHRVRDLTDDELAALIAQRRAKKFEGQSLYAAEEAMAVTLQNDERQTLQAIFQNAEMTQSGQPKPCPTCKKLIRIARKNVERRIQSLGGVVILRRHDHRCNTCELGFYPLDVALQLPTAGECSARLEKLIFDFGLHGPFAGAAARFEMHHGRAISENLVRRVVERMGNKAVADTMLPHRLRPPATAERLFADDNVMMSVWLDTVAAWLHAGRVRELTAQLQQCAFATRGKLRAAFVAAAKYFENNATRMKYDEYLAAGLPIGSGMIESAHRHVLQSRMKLAGQHWAPIRADRLAQLRAALATCGPINLYDAICA